jgi:hypothetical protein
MTATAAPNRYAPVVHPLSAAGVALLLAGPLLELTSELIAPREPEGLSNAGDVRFLLDHASRLTVSWMVGIFAAAALAAAYVVVAQRLVGRGRSVGTVAATLGVLGAVSLAGHVAVSLASLDVATEDGSLAAAVHAMESGRAALATFPFLVFGLNLAIILISVAAARAGLAPRWVIVLGVLAFLGDFSPTNYNTVIHAVFATLVFGFIANGLRRSALSDQRVE